MEGDLGLMPQLLRPDVFVGWFQRLRIPTIGVHVFARCMIRSGGMLASLPDLRGAARVQAIRLLPLLLVCILFGMGPSHALGNE